MNHVFPCGILGVEGKGGRREERQTDRAREKKREVAASQLTRDQKTFLIST